MTGRKHTAKPKRKWRDGSERDYYPIGRYLGAAGDPNSAPKPTRQSRTSNTNFGGNK